MQQDCNLCVNVLYFVNTEEPLLLDKICILQMHPRLAVMLVGMVVGMDDNA